MSPKGESLNPTSYKFKVCTTKTVDSTDIFVSQPKRRLTNNIPQYQALTVDFHPGTSLSESRGSCLTFFGAKVVHDTLFGISICK